MLPFLNVHFSNICFSIFFALFLIYIYIHNTLIFFHFFLSILSLKHSQILSLKKMSSSSSFDSSEFYNSSSDEPDRKCRVIHQRRELNNQIGRELVAYAESLLDGEGQRRRRRGPDQVRDREAAAELLMRDYFM